MTDILNLDEETILNYEFLHDNKSDKKLLKNKEIYFFISFLIPIPSFLVSEFIFPLDSISFSSFRYGSTIPCSILIPR